MSTGGFNFNNLGSFISTVGDTAGTIISAVNKQPPAQTTAPSQTTPLNTSPVTGVSSLFTNSGTMIAIGLGVVAIIIMVSMLKHK